MTSRAVKVPTPGALADGGGALTNPGPDGMALGMSTVDLKAQIDDLSEKLRALVRQRDGLDRQIEATKTRLEHFREAYELVSGQSVPDKMATATNGGVHRQLSKGEAWTAALNAMRAKGGEFTTDEVLNEANARGADMPRHSARGRLAELAAKRTLRRLRDGVFEFPTDAAA